MDTKEAGRKRWAGKTAEERRVHALKMVEARKVKGPVPGVEKPKVAPILPVAKKEAPKPVSVPARGQSGCVRHRMYEPDCEYCRLNRG